MSDVQSDFRNVGDRKPPAKQQQNLRWPNCRARNRLQSRAQKRLPKRRPLPKVPRHHRIPPQRLKPAQHLKPTAAPEKVEHGIGVLLVNLGTPDAPDAKSVRRYLKQFLTDPRVIEKRGLLWKLVLNGVILPMRPRRKARDYKQIWNNEREQIAAQDHHAVAGRKARRASCSRSATHVIVDWAMRYGNPSIASRLEALIARAATASWSCRSIRNTRPRPRRRSPTRRSAVLMKLRRQPTLRIAAALLRRSRLHRGAGARRSRPQLKALPFEPDVILLSFHGMPKDYVRQGRSLLLPLRAARRGCCASSCGSTKTS